jgi:hypothetical protein
MKRFVVAAAAVVAAAGVAAATAPRAEAAVTTSLTCVEKFPGFPENVSWICTALAVDDITGPVVGETVCFTTNAEGIFTFGAWTVVPDPLGGWISRLCTLTDASGAVVVEVINKTVPIDVTADFTGLGVVRFFQITGLEFAEQLIDDAEVLIDAFVLPEGISSALTSKLDEARAALAAGDVETACGSLKAMLRQLSAQIGKKLTPDQAAEISSAVEAIRAELGC